MQAKVITNPHCAFMPLNISMFEIHPEFSTTFSGDPRHLYWMGCCLESARVFQILLKTPCRESFPILLQAVWQMYLILAVPILLRTRPVLPHLLLYRLQWRDSKDGKFDAVLTGGIDRSMGPESYVKFCKIGALIC